MPDLIAQGSQPQHRWRRKLPAGVTHTIGRAAGPWSTPWDERISRRHIDVCWLDGRLIVKTVGDARNPVFFRGRRSESFDARPGDHFVIGGTTFTLTDERAQASLDMPVPVDQRTFSLDELRHQPYRRAAERIEVLSRLPDIISGSSSDSEMFVRLVNLLLSGIGRATAAAVVNVSATSETAPIEVLHWDRRILSGGDFRPSERLIRQAVQASESVAFVWSAQQPRGDGEFTLSEGVDWAFCTPIAGSSCKGWALYVTGTFSGDDFGPQEIGTEALRDDVKFTELTAATLCSLRESHFLARQQAGLSQFFSPLVLDALAGRDANQVLQPREADVTVLFCDLRGFARQSERSASNLLDLLERVSQALGVMTHHILQQGGVVGDFHGDSAMGFWGWPIAQEDAVERACRAALGIRAEFAGSAGNASRGGRPLLDFRVGIGIASGKAVAGKIGTVDQVKVTVFGPVVNLASRLEGMTKVLRAPILIDGPTAVAARERLSKDEARIRRVAQVRPSGVETAVEVSELLPSAAEAPTLTDAHLAAYEAALDALVSRDWVKSLKLLHQVPPEDLVKDFLTVFIAQHNRVPPPNWDGVINVETK
jgi:adenylate cyclase